jgi:DNA-binding IclR family transcriptional regulator
MSSLSRILQILDLFDLEQPFWTSEQIIETTGFTRPTAFRYLKALRDAGLLARFGGGYILGPKPVKLDYVIRQSDPLLNLFEPIMERVRDETDCDVILASLLGNDFFATIHVRSDSTNVSWPRGRSMPLTRGAGGHAVLSALPKRQLQRLLADPHVNKSVTDADALLAELQRVAREGYALSLGALEPENVGIAVPVVLDGIPPAALIMVMGRKRFKTTNRDLIVEILKGAREHLGAAYRSLNSSSEHLSAGVRSR